VKVHFELKDNVIDKNLQTYIDKMHFAHRKNLAFMIQDLKWFYADKFHSGSIDKAKSKLETFNKKMRRSDLAYIYFFGGMSCTMTFMGVSFLFLKSSDGKDYDGVMVSSL